MWLWSCFLSVPLCLLKTTDFLPSLTLLPLSLSPGSPLSPSLPSPTLADMRYPSINPLAFTMGWPYRKPTFQVAPINVKSAVLCSFWDGQQWPGTSCTWSVTCTWIPGSRLLSSTKLVWPCFCWFPLFRFKPPRLENTFYWMFVHSAARQTWCEAESLHCCKSRLKHPLFLCLIIFFHSLSLKASQQQ